MSEATIELFHPVYLPEMERAVIDVLRSGKIATGPMVSEFEKRFGSIVGRQHIVSTSDLSSAVTLALHLAGVSEGDEVATLAFSCLQSNSPISRLGARPIWIDVEPETMSMSVNDLATKLKPSVKAVMVYHVAGYHADTVSIAKLCRERGIPLIEDCNNAIGATFNGKPAGTLGDYAVYSLYPNRQINGIDGGMLATPDAITAKRAASLRRFGIDPKSFRDKRGEISEESDITEIGWSCSLSQVNATIAVCQLNTLNERIKKTRTTANQLKNKIDNISNLRLVSEISEGISAYWGLLIRSENRNELLTYLKQNGVNCSILHQRNDWYTGFGGKRANLPGTKIAMDQLLALPCGWWLSNSQINRIVKLLLKFEAEL